LIAMAELPKRYDPKAVEPKWYQRWIDDHDFVANSKSSKPPFSIVMPPPNVTGVLTLGHVLNDTIQDILCRRGRMQGFEVLWLPGMDHAGIGTQTAAEKYWRRTENKTRHDFGREECLRRAHEWQDTHGGIIVEQPTRRWRFIQATHDTSISWANTCGARSPARRFPSSLTKQSIRSSEPAF